MKIDSGCVTLVCGNPERNPDGNYSPTLIEYAKQNGIEYLHDFAPEEPVVAFNKQERERIFAAREGKVDGNQPLAGFSHSADSGR